MKYLIFNIVVVAALVHLYAGKDFSVSDLTDWAKGKTEQVTSLPREVAAQPAVDVQPAAAPKPAAIAAPVEAEAQAQVRAPQPVPEPEPVPQIETTARPALAPPRKLEPVPEIEVPLRPDPVPPPAEAVQRRAEVLGDVSEPDKRVTMPSVSRRQELLTMAEEMELFSVELAQ